MFCINGFDIDGVITVGIYPGPNDIIITGRSIEEKDETLDMLDKKGIVDNNVWFNPVKFGAKSREQSGLFKAMAIKRLLCHHGVKVINFFEDDTIQAAKIREYCPWVNVIDVVHELTEKENVRHIGDY